MLGAVFAAACGGDSNPPPPTAGGGNHPPTSIAFALDTVRLVAGASRTLGITVDGAPGQPSDFTWRSDDPSIASVSNTGVVTAGHRGLVKISVASGMVSAAVQVRVTDNVSGVDFRSPLADEAPVLSVFDHDLPFEFGDSNGFLRSFWGEKVLGIDGHNGYDWVIPTGTPVLAAGAGVIQTAGNEAPFSCPLLNNATVSGMWVTIGHDLPNGDRVFTQYGHLSRIDVAVGQHVSRGQQIGLSGSTGCSTTPHLHFSAYYASSGSSGARMIDPYGWQANFPDPWADYSNGSASPAIWSSGAAPHLFAQVTLAAVAAVPSPVVITRIRAMGVDDDHHPNNEWIELAANPTATSAQSLDGYRVRSSVNGAYTFPQGVTLRPGAAIHVYSGAGTNSDTALYWGRTTPAINNLGDCIELLAPSGAVAMQVNLAGVCLGSTSIAAARVFHVAPFMAVDAPSPHSAAQRTSVPSRKHR